MNGGQEDFIPYWLQTGASWLNAASPFGADLKQPAWPDPPAPHSASKTRVNALLGPVMHAWEYPWPHTSPMESRLDMWAQSTQPSPSAAPPHSALKTSGRRRPSSRADAVNALLPHLIFGKYWPVAPSVANDQPPAHGFYFSPMPQAPSWDQVPAYPADNAAPSFSQPPSSASKSAFTRVFDASWATPTPGVNAGEYSRADEAAMAQQARDAAGKTFGRREQQAVRARSASPAPDIEADAGDPGLKARMRLNFLDSYYRGTLAGASRLAYLAHLAATPDAPGINPDLKRVRDGLREEHRQITADLARYERMRLFENRSELAASALGQIGGAIPSPENWLGLGARGASALWRAGKAALQQGAITGLADPIVQGLNIKAGVQDNYSPVRTGLAFGLGAALGGGAQLGLEGFNRAAARGGRAVPARTLRSRIKPPSMPVVRSCLLASGLRTQRQRCWLGPTCARRSRISQALPGYRTSGHYPFASPPVSFHYTFGKAAPSIANEGLKAGSYVTPTGNLSPLQAHIDLALPPNRGLPDALLRVDLEGLRRDGYDIPAITRVGRSYGMPGGDYEMKVPYRIPPQYIKVIKP